MPKCEGANQVHEYNNKFDSMLVYSPTMFCEHSPRSHTPYMCREQFWAWIELVQPMNICLQENDSNTWMIGREIKMEFVECLETSLIVSRGYYYFVPHYAIWIYG